MLQKIGNTRVKFLNIAKTNSIMASQLSRFRHLVIIVDDDDVIVAHVIVRPFH